MNFALVIVVTVVVNKVLVIQLTCNVIVMDSQCAQAGGLSLTHHRWFGQDLAKISTIYSFIHHANDLLRYPLSQVGVSSPGGPPCLPHAQGGVGQNNVSLAALCSTLY